VRKTIDHGRVVATCCMGTRRLYDYIDCNPVFSFRPAEYVCDPVVITGQHAMVAINTALEADLIGQVCAGSLAGRFFSGLGSHIDFIRAAGVSPGGKSIVVLDSTRSNGSASRIVPQISGDAAVAGTIWESHYIVTEFGVAYLRGKTVQERALSLITVAHPRFRPGLLREAIARKYVSGDIPSDEGRMMVGPAHLCTSQVLADGTQVDFRPMHPTDERLVRELFGSLSPSSLHHRFMTNLSRVPVKQIENFVYIDYRIQMAIVGTLPASHGQDIIAVGRYWLDQKTNRAEVAFTVRDRWQNRGIGTFLLNYLISVARRNGIGGFTAEVLAQNKAMMRVFTRSGYRLSSSLDDGVYSVHLDF
jgi:GNAT superfamily N-acetyltransferase